MGIVATLVFVFTRNAEVKISTYPDDAEIKINQETKAQGLFVNDDLKAGTYDLVVRRSGFRPVMEEIQLERGKKMEKEIQLEPINHPFELKTNPREAQYKITTANGEVKEGQTPLKEEVPAGNLHIELTAANRSILERDYFHDSEDTLYWHLDPEGQIVHLLRSIETGPSPKGAVFNSSGDEIWTTHLMSKREGVGIYNLEGDKIGGLELDGHGGVEIVFSSDGSRAYISQMETDTVFEIDTQARTILRRFKTHSTWCKVLELSPDEKILYVSNWSGNNISEIDLESGELIRLLPTIKTPRGLYPTKDGQNLYIAGFGRGELMRISLEKGNGEILYKSDGAMRHIVADEDKGRLFVSDMANNIIYLYNINSGEVSEFVTTETNPNTIALSPDKKILYVSCRGENASDSYYVPGPEWGSVFLFDAETGEILDVIIGGNQPTGLDISPDGSRLVFSNFLDANMELYEIPDYETLKNGGGGRAGNYSEDLKK